MKLHKPTESVPLFEVLEGRQCLSATVSAADVLVPAAKVSSARHHAHHLHTLLHVHTQHSVHEANVQRREAHHTHHVHFLHTQHRAHVLRTTVPEPLVLTAQQRNDWPSIRDEVLSNRRRIEI